MERKLVIQLIIGLCNENKIGGNYGKFTRDSRENLLYMLIECSPRKEDGT